MLLLVGLAYSNAGRAQMFETRTGVDTLTLGERISVHANLAGWALLVPNVGVEFDIKNTNWNRWAVGLDLKARWQTSSNLRQQHFYCINEARLYYRNYWRSRHADGKDLKKHTNILDKTFSCRRTNVRHPRTTYYRGAYLMFSDISYKIMGLYCRQGQVASAGVTYGIVKPLFGFSSGNTIDLDLGFDAGFVATHIEKLRPDGNCYIRVKPAEWKFLPYPIPTEARVGLVYRFGKYPITKKYRWRYDVDVKYQEAMRDRMLEQERLRREKQNADSLYRLVSTDFMHCYDSIAAANAKAEAAKVALAKKQADELKQAEAQKKAEELKKAKEEKLKAKESKKSEANDSTATEPGLPTATESEQPSSTEGEQPTATEGEQPSATEGEQPTATEGEQPTATEGEQPTATEGEMPTATEGEQPSATEGEQPSATEGEQPTATEGEQPTTTEGEQPAVSEGEQPTASEESNETENNNQ